MVAAMADTMAVSLIFGGAACAYGFFCAYEARGLPGLLAAALVVANVAYAAWSLGRARSGAVSE